MTRGMQRHGDTREKANFLRSNFLKKKSSLITLPLLFRDTDSLQADKCKKTKYRTTCLK